MTSEESRSVDGARTIVGSPVIRRVVTVLALVWLTLLCWMAATSANPTMVNAAMLLRCDAVLSAEVKDSKVAAIERLWRGEEPELPIAVPAEFASSDGQYVLLLSRASGRWTIARSPGTEELLMYPATEDVVRQLESLIEAP